MQSYLLRQFKSIITRDLRGASNASTSSITHRTTPTKATTLPIFFTKMDEVPQESLRKHRQQVTPQIGTNGGEQFSNKTNYGALPAPDKELLSVAQKDKDKVFRDSFLN